MASVIALYLALVQGVGLTRNGVLMMDVLDIVASCSEIGNPCTDLLSFTGAGAARLCRIQSQD